MPESISSSQNQHVILRYCISSCPSSWIPMKIYESNTSVWGNLLPFKSDPFSSIWDLKQLGLWQFLTSTKGITFRVEGILKMPSSQTGPWWEVPMIWYVLITAEYHSYVLAPWIFSGSFVWGGVLNSHPQIELPSTPRLAIVASCHFTRARCLVARGVSSVSGPAVRRLSSRTGDSGVRKMKFI